MKSKYEYFNKRHHIERTVWFCVDRYTSPGDVDFSLDDNMHDLGLSDQDILDVEKDLGEEYYIKLDSYPNSLFVRDLCDKIFNVLIEKYNDK